MATVEVTVADVLADDPRESWTQEAVTPQASARPEAARAIWDAIEAKRHTKPENFILAINAIRTPRFIQTVIVEAPRRQYGQDAPQV